MKIIGLTGYAGSGKDEAARGLTAHGWERLAFADPLRELLRKANPLIVHPSGFATPGYSLAALVNYLGWTEAKRNPEVRRLLQDLGQGARDVFGPECWIAALDRRAGELDPATPGLVVTDVRYENEADYLRARGGRIVRIVRPGVGPINAHASEQAIVRLRVDGEIVNSADAAALHDRLCYPCDRVRWPDGSRDSDPYVLVERTDGADEKEVLENWKR